MERTKAHEFTAACLIILGAALLLVAGGDVLGPTITGRAIDIGPGYVSPQTGPGYVAPSSDQSYVSPAAGPGYQKAETGPGYQRAETGPGYVAPVSDDTYSAPRLGSGYVKPGGALPANGTQNQTSMHADNTTRNESTGNATNRTGDQTTNMSKQKPNGTSDESRTAPRSPKFVGAWRVFSDSIYYPDGGFSYRTTPDSLLAIHEDGTWSFATFSGTWRTENISADDWAAWGVNPYGPIRKIILDGLPGSMGAPIEEDLAAIRFLWAIYDEPEGRVWQKFGPAGKQKIFVEGVTSGKVRSADGRIDCGTACSAEYNYSAIITIKAFPDRDHEFVGWLAGCEGTDPTCIIDLRAPTTVIPIFTDAGCSSDDECPTDQACVESACAAPACACGTVQNHQCRAYACCSDAQCGGGSSCNDDIHQCIQASACRPLVTKGDPADKIDVVFVGAGFDNATLFEKSVLYVLDYDGIYNGVFSVAPFKENANTFNVWTVLAPDYVHYASVERAGGRDFETFEPDVADYHRFVRTCERDLVVVFSPHLFRPHATFATSERGFGTVYYSGAFPVLRGVEYMGRLMLHELGHAVGGLADEYVEYGRGSVVERYGDLPNCAADLATAQRIWGDLEGVDGVGYYTGIGNVTGTTYYRSADGYDSVPELGRFSDGSDWGDGGCSYDWKNVRPTVGSIMKIGTEFEYDFGPVNERALARKMEGFR